jgi:hypothetical protein
MSSPSPSEFLTFYRRVTLSSTLRHATTSSSLSTTRPLQATYTRDFSLSSRFQKTDKYPGKLSTDDSVKTDRYPDDEHATSKVKKGDHHDVQSSNLKGGME